MRIEIPKYNYTKDQLDELEEALYQFMYELETPENRKLVDDIISTKVEEFVKSNREKKLNQILPDGTS